MDRIDTVDEYFQLVTKVNKWSAYLFWFSVLCSCLSFFTDKSPLLNTGINIIFIIVTVAYFILSNWMSLSLLREAQGKRRIHLLSNALGVKLDDEHTQLFYNNSQKESLVRLGVNVFENTLFTWKVTAEMAKTERVKLASYILFFILLTLINGININFISIIAQTVFTTGLIVNGIRLEILRSSCKQLFNEFRQVFLTNGTNSNKKVSATLLNLVFKYETTVASMGVHTSSKVFNRINSKISAEWEKIKLNLNL
ncbi:hypothetical protein ABE65_000960 [Fictibacillus phosphorivorans]|uniref:Uncharacterized protein n=1 Tax=Fictibacillus phosphorivorans TaxID=1221500 RepID=A0A160IIJ6_9BACL|nr:hypothetical protein [Fictibacillus phosphorivorans]ANC75507.1 hypothetical protein ABE65_000960 [Fictibacillus phosphorivorans]